MASTNSAAWLNAAKMYPFEIKPSEMWTPGDNEILVQNRAIAVNPIDHALQAFAWYPLPYPTILGQDVAGDVVAVGPKVTSFKLGDRILAFAVGFSTKRQSDNAFQAFTIVNEHMASKIPAEIPYESAAVVPLGLSTAACGLFQDAPFLALDYPTSPRRQPNGRTLLIWGGSSSVGSNGIQMAVAAGYEVVATASPKNFEYVKKLGASQVFDYNSTSIRQDLIGAFEGKTCAGALDCIGGEAAIICADTVQKVAGKGVVATTKPGGDMPDGITLSRILATTLNDNAVGPAIFRDYLPKALAAGEFVPSPNPSVFGKGLESLQGAVDKMGKGVSAEKIVVSL